MTVDKQTITKKNFSQEAISIFIKCVRGQSWNSLDSLDVQNPFSLFQRVIDLHFEEHFPKRTVIGYEPAGLTEHPPPPE